MPRPDFPKSILDFQRRFGDEEACVDYLLASRWPDGYVCPRCGHDAYWWIETRLLAECRRCHYQASPTAGTVMHRTRQPLRNWFYAAYLMTTLTPGVSAVQLQRQLGLGSYATAYHMLHKLRAATLNPERDRLRGLAEVDETYVGGPKPGKRGRGAAGKAIVIAAIEVLHEGEKKERAGRLRLRLIPNVEGPTLTGFVKDVVVPRSRVRTDDFASYNGLRAKKYRHEVVGANDLTHVHRSFTNLKGFLRGTYHGVSRKHLQAYLNEFVFRHNRRRTPMAAFQTILGLASRADSPTWEGLAKGRWVHPNPLGYSEATR